MAPESANATPLVSAVIIFLDAVRFLEEAITSVFAQTCANWELLLVDDGSTDGSTAIARRYADEWPDRVRYLEHRGHANRGMSASRNLGIAQARGEYIAFLDSDDVWLPNKLAEQVELLASHEEAGMVCGPSMYWYGWTGSPDDAARDHVNHLGTLRDTLVSAPRLLPLALTGEVTTPCPSNILLRRSVVTAVGGFEEHFRGIHQLYEDQAFLAKVQLATGVYLASTCWDKYRKHPDSLVAQVKRLGKTGDARRYYLKWLAGYLRAHAIAHPEVRAALRKELRAHRLAALRRLGGGMSSTAYRAVARRLVPATVRRRLRAHLRREEYVPLPGAVRFGDLRRRSPISRKWGKDRCGTPIDRVYIDRFLGAHAMDIHGRVLEVGDDSYARAFGGARVEQCDVLHAMPGNPRATIVADLANGDGVRSSAYDCVILTQVLHVMPHPAAAIRTVHRILRPGGVVLATLAGISQISRWDMERWGDYWRFTTLSAERLFSAAFPSDHVTVEAHGNVLAAVAFLHGLAAEELRPEELDHHDPDFQLLITVRAMRPGSE